MIKAMITNISIILPNYNHAEQLHTSLSAIFNQTEPADEIIIIDDASTDHSRNVIKKFTADNPRVRVLSNEKNMGVAYTVKRGVEAAKSRYVILASADEKIGPTMVKTLSQAMETFPEAKMAVSNYAEWQPESRDVIAYDRHLAFMQRWLGAADTQFISPAQVRKMLNEGLMRLQTTTAIFDRQALLDIDVFDPTLKWLGDWFTIHALALRHGTVVVPETLSLFRLDNRSFSAQGLKNRAAHTEILDRLFTKLRHPAYRDIYECLRSCPSAISPAVRMFLPYAFRNFLNDSLCRVWVLWYLGRVIRGQRPMTLSWRKDSMPRKLKQWELF